MTSRSAAGLFFALPIALCLSIGPQPPKTAELRWSSSPAAPTPITTPQGLTEPEDQLRPSLGDETGATGAPPPDDEITPTAVDEGAGWEAAVEAAQAATPLIGEAQTKAVERINAYFNNITNLQGSFEQVDATNKRTTGRFYVQRPGKIRFDYAPPSGLRIVADGSSLAIEDSDLRTVEKYPIQSTPFRLLLVGLGRSRPRCPHRRGREPGRHARHLARGQIGRRGRKHQARVRQRRRAPAEAVVDHRRARLDDAGGRQRHRLRVAKVATDFFTSKDSFQPFR